MPTRAAPLLRRRMVHALGFSLVLHGFLLLPGVVRRLPAQGARPLQAVLVAAPPHAAPLPARATPLQQRPALPDLMPVSPRKTVRPRPADSPDSAPAPRPAQVLGALPADDGLDGEGLRTYRIALAVGARRQRLALPATGLNGRVGVRITTEPAGVRVNIAASSGLAEVDAAALRLMQAAVVEAPIPESLRGKIFAVDVPVVFGVPAGP